MIWDSFFTTTCPFRTCGIRDRSKGNLLRTLEFSVGYEPQVAFLKESLCICGHKKTAVSP
jgi:hypothetical protein